MAGEVEHFDVYGEVRTMYSQVYWTRNAPIALPPEIVERFKGKVMANTIDCAVWPSRRRERSHTGSRETRSRMLR